MDKINIFRNELDLIQDKFIKDLVERCLQNAPQYFFEMPASTTGKHHPSYTLGYGGLVRHTKAAVKIAVDLVGLEQYSHINKDCVIAALILHDSHKKGTSDTGSTVPEHPILASQFVGEQYEIMEKSMEPDELTFQLVLQVATIQKLIESHMGEWNLDYVTGKEILPKPIDEWQKFVHLCDYLASRKYITCEVE